MYFGNIVDDLDRFAGFAMCLGRRKVKNTFAWMLYNPGRKEEGGDWEGYERVAIAKFLSTEESTVGMEASTMW